MSANNFNLRVVSESDLPTTDITNIDLELPYINKSSNIINIIDNKNADSNYDNVNKLLLVDGFSHKIVKDIEDNVYVTFSADSRIVKVETHYINNAEENRDIYVVKLDSDNKHKWIVKVAEVSDDVEPSIVVSNNIVYLVFFSWSGTNYSLHRYTLRVTDGTIESSTTTDINNQELNINGDDVSYVLIINCDLYVSSSDKLHLVMTTITTKTDNSTLLYSCYYKNDNMSSFSFIDSITSQSQNQGSYNYFTSRFHENNVYILYSKHEEEDDTTIKIVKIAASPTSSEITSIGTYKPNIVHPFEHISFVVKSTTEILLCANYVETESNENILEILSINEHKTDGSNSIYVLNVNNSFRLILDNNEGFFELEEHNNDLVLCGRELIDDEVENNELRQIIYYIRNKQVVYKTVDDKKYDNNLLLGLQYVNKNFIIDSKGDIVFLNVSYPQVQEGEQEKEDFNLEIKKIARQPIILIEYALGDTETLLLPVSTTNVLGETVLISGRLKSSASNVFKTPIKIDVSQLNNNVSLSELLQISTSLDTSETHVIVRVVGKFDILGLGEDIDTNTINNTNIFDIQDFNEISPYLTSLNGLFARNSIFNKNIGDWDVSNIKDMTEMFFEATAFNNGDPSPTAVERNINKTNATLTNKNKYIKSRNVVEPAISTWNVSNVTTFNRMFLGSISFNQSISNWNMLSATEVTSMFERAVNFNNGLGIDDLTGALHLLYIDGVESNGLTIFNTTNNGVIIFEKFLEGTKLLTDFEKTGQSEFILYALLFLEKIEEKPIKIHPKGMVVKTGFAVTCGVANGVAKGVSLSNDGIITASKSLSTDIVGANKIIADSVLTTKMTSTTLIAKNIVLGDYVLNIDDNGALCVSRINGDCP